ncbi:MAG TPA: malto-oligosyltrehalose synthase [bacterium]|nr:malto-oligosyltrehalose synthase [bacterium]
MIATYRLQLGPQLGFDDARAALAYLRKLGVSHLYLSPITEARPGSTHGYDVVDHNRIREELGGADAFWALVDAARGAGLGIIVDFVPNHAYTGPENARWQDVLAHGPDSPYAFHFDIDWEPLKPELRGKILLPFLGSPYGDALDRGEIGLVWDHGALRADYFGNRFALAPATYADVLAAALSRGARRGSVDALEAVADEFRRLATGDRATFDALRTRLDALLTPPDVAALREVRGAELHAILERQHWRLSYWQTAPHEINYRRFFDVNELIGLRMEQPDVFAEAHRLLAQLLTHRGIDGVRIDHIDGLVDPHGYLEALRALGPRGVWVEKILGHGETLPEEWSVDGTVGYDFLNDVLQLLTYPGGRIGLERAYRQFTGVTQPYGSVVREAKRLVMETSLAGELYRLAYVLDRISEADYHTRDFTLEALRDALAQIVAVFPRYRTYLPHDRDEGTAVIREAAQTARLRNPGTEPTVYAFVANVLTDPSLPERGPLWTEWLGRFQQYTAPVAAKGVEDTAFYRYLPFVALNEVGGDPDRFGLPLQAFHARARYRALRYPRTLLATATHDHKRGEDTRMRMIALAETPETWRRTVGALSRVARRYRRARGPSRADEFLFYQTLVAVWTGADRATLTDRLCAYMLKASREAKRRTSWVSPDAAYEADLEQFVRGMTEDPRVARAIEPLATALTRIGFANALSQLVLKLTTPGVPDFYQGADLLDGSLVDPDNRRPVDFALRARLLESLEPRLARPDPSQLRGWVEAADERAKLYATARLLRFRRGHADLFAGSYRALEAAGDRANHLIAFARESGDDALLALVPRFPATLERLGGWANTHVPLPDTLAARRWVDVLTGEAHDLGAEAMPAVPPVMWRVLYAEGRA